MHICIYLVTVFTETTVSTTNGILTQLPPLYLQHQGTGWYVMDSDYTNVAYHIDKYLEILHDFKKQQLGFSMKMIWLIFKPQTIG